MGAFPQEPFLTKAPVSSFRQQQPFRGKGLHKCFSGQEPVWRATPRSLPRAAPAAGQSIPFQSLLIFHIPAYLPFSQSPQPGYKLVSSRCQYLPRKGAGSVAVIGIRAWSRGQCCLGVTTLACCYSCFKTPSGSFCPLLLLDAILEKEQPSPAGTGRVYRFTSRLNTTPKHGVNSCVEGCS